MQMSETSTHSLSRNKGLPTKLVMGVMVAAVSVLVGTAGVASATPGPSENGNDSSSRNANSGNKGWERGRGHQNGHSNGQGHGDDDAHHGYGGGGNIGGGINIDLGSIVGDNNVINIVINYFIGR